MNKVAVILTVILSTTVISCLEETEKESTPSEIDIYNDIIDTLYNIKYCNLIMIEPELYFRFDEKIDSIKYFRYKKEYDTKINEFRERLDTTIKITFVYDSLYQIDPTNDREFLLSNLGDEDSVYFNLFDLQKAALPLSIDSLKQEDINFMYTSQLPESFKCSYGFVGDEFWIGSVSFSRILIDWEEEIGMFSFGYTGNCDCGYGGYYFIRKVKERWEIHKHIITWQS